MTSQDQNESRNLCIFFFKYWWLFLNTRYQPIVCVISGSGGKYDATHERTMQEFKSAMKKQAVSI